MGTLAKLQRILTLILVGSAAGWEIWFASVGLPFVATIGALLVLLAPALLLGFEFVLLHRVQNSSPVPRPLAAQLARAWGGEVIAAARVFLWRQPFRSNTERDNVPAKIRAQAGVVFVHGFVCNRGFWNPWLRELRRRHVPFVAVNLEPIFGPIDDYVLAIEQAVARIERATALPVVLVGHSMGGLAIRAWLAHFDADARVRRVITIGSPHQGTWLARYAHSRPGNQMRLSSAWLTNLAAREPASRHARFTCFFGHCDNIVFPSACATLPGALNVHLPGVAHVRMAFETPVSDELSRWLEPAADA